MTYYLNKKIKTLFISIELSKFTQAGTFELKYIKV